MEAPIVPIADLVHGITEIRVQEQSLSGSCESERHDLWFIGRPGEYAVHNFNPRLNATTKGIGQTPNGRLLRITITTETI